MISVHNFTCRVKMTRLLLPMLLLMFAFMQNAESVCLNLPRSGNKCVTEEVHDNAVVVGDYVVFSDAVDHLHPSPTISITVTSPSGNIIHHKENVTHGEFAFTSTESGSYQTCFLPGEGDLHSSVSIDWKIGIQQRIGSQLLEKKKLRDPKMRGVSETTNSRVAWYSISSLGICILASCTQLWYLTRYFQKKKLI